MKKPLNKTNIQNKIDTKELQIERYNAEIAELQYEVDALTTAYDNIHSTLGDFYDVYPDASSVVPTLFDDKCWKGNVCSQFEYDFADVYSMSLSALSIDSIEAEENISIEINVASGDIDKDNRCIELLDTEIWTLKKELWLAD